MRRRKNWLRWIWLAVAGGCYGCSSLSWTCTVPVQLVLEDTRTTIRCPVDGRQVVIAHPKGTRVAP